MTLTFKTSGKMAILAYTAVAGMAFSPAAHAQDATFSEAQKENIGAIVKEYLMDNPNVIMEAIDAYRSQQEQEAQKRAEAQISGNMEFLTRADAPSVGNPEGDITIVEFFDYNCGYCKRALPDIQKVVESDKNVRVVFKEMPILGPTSKIAALWALAAHNQDKYFDFHIALMEHRGPKDEAQMEKLAEKTGLDIEQMKKDIASGELEKELQKVLDVAREIGVSGTPAFIVGSSFIPGYVGEEGLKQAIKAEREKRKNDG